MVCRYLLSGRDGVLAVREEHTALAQTGEVAEDGDPPERAPSVSLLRRPQIKVLSTAPFQTRPGRTTLNGVTTLLELLRARWNCRRYKTDPVPRAMVETILEAARLAPSACNRQPWRFAVVTDAAQRQRLFDEGFLPGLGMKWALDAPVMLVLGSARSLVTWCPAAGEAKDGG